MEGHDTIVRGTTLVLRFWWNFELRNCLKILTKLSPNILEIFRLFPQQFLCPPKKLLRNYIYYALQYFHLCQSFEITILAEILNILSKFGKDLIFRSKFSRNFPWSIDETFGAATLEYGIKTGELLAKVRNKNRRNNQTCRFGRVDITPAYWGEIANLNRVGTERHT